MIYKVLVFAFRSKAGAKSEIDKECLDDEGIDLCRDLESELEYKKGTPK